MMPCLQQFLHDESAQDLIEYALLSAVLGIGCITGILQLAGLRQFMEMVGDALTAAP